jgi:hypothetical protein
MHMQKGIATLSAAEQLYGETTCMERVVHGDMHGEPRSCKRLAQIGMTLVGTVV